VLRPPEPLDLKENQKVSVTTSDSPEGLADAWLDHEYMAAVDAMDEAKPSLDRSEPHFRVFPVIFPMMFDVNVNREDSRVADLP
jgi:hypothetical protein